MKIALSVKDKTRFIDGSVLTPDGNDLNLLSSWIRNTSIYKKFDGYMIQLAFGSARCYNVFLNEDLFGEIYMAFHLVMAKGKGFSSRKEISMGTT